MRKGRLAGQSVVPEYIETPISHVFLFTDEVYKVYKEDSVFFNTNFRDISSVQSRLTFSESDFSWNHRLSPDIYLGLKGLSIGASGQVVLIDKPFPATLTEVACVTKRLRTEDLLYARLRTDTGGDLDFYSLGRDFAQSENAFTDDESIPAKSPLEDMQSRIIDIDHWGSETMRDIDSFVWKKGMKYLEDSADGLLASESSGLEYCFDVHMFNAFIFENHLRLFDTSPPKQGWKFGASPINVYRLASDIYALVGVDAYHSFLRGYQKSSIRQPLRPEQEIFWLVYASMIMVPYLYMLARSDKEKHSAAEIYKEFLQEKLERVAA